MNWWIWGIALLAWVAFRAWYDNWRGPVTKAEVDAYFRANLLGRETTARDVARAFAHLAAAEATTGCVLTVDGGNAAAFPR